MSNTLIGSVFERTTHAPSAPSPRFTATPGAGFPTAQHRFKSAFGRARDQGNVGRTDGPPVVSRSFIAPTVDSKHIQTDTDALRHQIHEENARRIAHMSDEQIEVEKRAILEQLGEGTSELLKCVQAARRRKEERERETEHKRQSTAEGDDYTHPPFIVSPSSHRAPHGLATKPGILRVKSLENIGQSVPSPLPPTSSTRPSSRTGRRLRFAEVTPDDVHVYESAPRSPKQAVLALPPPPDTKDDSIVSLGTYDKNTLPFKRSVPADESIKAQLTIDEPQEGTPEYIRRRYFPSVPANDPSVAWMDASSQEATDISVPRFDLHGAPIPASLSASLPSHLGLHHHAEGSHAGYTIDDIFLLSRSTVPAQRASMLGILAKIAHRLSRQMQHFDSPENITAFAGREGELRKRILTAGLASVDQIGSLGAQAVEVIFECLVEWDKTTNDVERVELALAPDIVSSMQLDYFLPKIADVFSHAALPSESLAQLLAVVHWLAQQSNKVAEMVTNIPRLIPTILKTFLLTPIPPREESLSPNPLALQLLITLASASRSNASVLLDPTDALLRFVTLLPSSSPYPPALASTLLTYTLCLYTTFASYGLYAHIATTASQLFSTLASYIPSTDTLASLQLRTAWASLVQAWIVCATDPHATSPPHEILWSQVCAWGWASEVRKLRNGLGNDRSDWAAYAAIWDAEAGWLEGARINGVKSGDGERQEALQILNDTFSVQDGTEFWIVQCAVEQARRDLTQGVPTTIRDGKRALESLASAGHVLASALHLFLACISSDAPQSAPPFALPLSDFSALCATLVKHSIWSLPRTLGAIYLQVYLRPLTRFLVQFHRVSRFIPGTTPQLWLAQTLVFLSRFLPGDESHAISMLDAFSLVTPQLVDIDPAEFPQSIHVDVLRPFFEYTVRPEREVYIAPVLPNPESISRCSTLRLPSLHNVESNDDSVRTLPAGLPLTSDFLFTPLTHLLRSGTSPVFGNLPANWHASEVDVVRATLLFALAARRVLIGHNLPMFACGPAQVVFACMRVCMLEHGVGTEETEVFRDTGVERLMGCLLEPWTVRAFGRGVGVSGTLEDASAPYLGATPFYQFYTDLVALYGAVSFGHRLFAVLVVTPLAMGYAVDYRRAFWCSGGGASGGHGDSEGGGIGDVVKNVRIPIEDVVCTGPLGLREYLYPIERDVGMLGAYVSALVVGVEGFLRFVAVHHVASAVWGEENEEVRARMLRVLIRGNVDAVRDVVLYQQCERGDVVFPPTCYQDGEWRERRLLYVRQAMGEGAEERLRGLLMT